MTTTPIDIDYDLFIIVIEAAAAASDNKEYEVILDELLIKNEYQRIYDELSEEEKDKFLQKQKNTFYFVHKLEKQIMADRKAIVKSGGEVTYENFGKQAIAEAVEYFEANKYITEGMVNEHYENLNKSIDESIDQMAETLTKTLNSCMELMKSEVESYKLREKM